MIFSNSSSADRSLVRSPMGNKEAFRPKMCLKGRNQPVLCIQELPGSWSPQSSQHCSLLGTFPLGKGSSLMD